MKRLLVRLLLAVLALAALVVGRLRRRQTRTAASPPRVGRQHGRAVNLTQGSGLTFAMVTHSDEGSFWSVVKKGAEQAAKDEGVKLIWSPSNNDPQKEAQLIDAAVSQKVDGLAVSVPERERDQGLAGQGQGGRHPDHHAQLRRRATSKELGAITHVGQTEAIAGQAAGARLKADGVKKVLCVIHEQNNIGLAAALRRRQAGLRRRR